MHLVAGQLFPWNPSMVDGGMCMLTCMCNHVHGDTCTCQRSWPLDVSTSSWIQVRGCTAPHVCSLSYFPTDFLPKSASPQNSQLLRDLNSPFLKVFSEACKIQSFGSFRLSRCLILGKRCILLMDGTFLPSTHVFDMVQM